MQKMQKINFGKHKGKPFEALADHPDWVQWALDNSVMQKNQPELYQFVVNGLRQPNETPAHNRLQVKFLDDSAIRAMLEHAGNFPPGIAVTIRTKRFENQGWDVTARVEVCGFSHLRREDNRSSSFHPNFSERREYEGLGYPPYKPPKDDYLSHFAGDYVTMFRARLIGYFDLGIELKPSMGDDYPDVLRQVKGHGKIDERFVVIEQFTASGATFEQVRQIFAHDGIIVLLGSEFL